MGKSRRNKTTIRVLLTVFVLGAIVAGVLGVRMYRVVFEPVVEKRHQIFLETATPFSQLVSQLAEDSVIPSKSKIHLVARLKKFDHSVAAGRYLILQGMSYNSLINLFRSGNQTPVQLTFNNIRTREEMAGVLSKQLMSDSVMLVQQFRNEEFVQEYGFDIHTALCPFIPNTYEVYWNIPPEKLYERMVNEFTNFWTSTNIEKAKTKGLTTIEVVILASIVEEETRSSKEKPIVAGLYLNRLNRGIPLQADPTLRFAKNDFTIKRVLNEHKKIDSPYNTYKYKGLPPGPIRVPEISTIKAVLNAKKHKYIYMCAKADFSGEHNFASTLKQHNKNAREYQRELNKRKIYR